MSRRFLSLIATLLFSVSAFASGGNGGGGSCTCVSLSVSKETAPAGSLAQMKVFVTEPKPISTGTGSLTFDAYDALVGIALASHARDSYGVAVVRGSSMTMSVISPSATLASSVDYPILTVVGHVPAGTPLGTKFQFTIPPNALQLYDTTGTLYPVDVKNGQLVAGNTVVISDVIPGSAIVPPGGVVRILGANFAPGTNVKFAEANLSSIQYISPNEIDVTVGTIANMHGMMIKVSAPNGTSDTYFSYQRTYPMSPSADPVMQLVMPLLPPNEVTSATIAIPAPAASTTYGVALQNIESADAVATVELLDGTGASVASTQVTVTASSFTVRELSELFGAAPADVATVRVTTSVPLEVLGVVANQTTGTAAPILAQ